MAKKTGEADGVAERPPRLPKKAVRGGARPPAGRAREDARVGEARRAEGARDLRGARRRRQGRRHQADHGVPVNPRVCRVVALPAPTERERTQWYFQRYVAHLPSAGEIVLFDRSWYNRAGVERVMGFCTEEEYREFLRSCPEFERMLIRSGIIARQVLVLGQRRRAGAALPGPHRRSDEALEAQPDGPEVARAVGRLLDGQGRDVRPHRHQAGARGSWSRPTTSAAPASTASAHLLSQVPYEDLTPGADHAAARARTAAPTCARR